MDAWISIAEAKTPKDFALRVETAKSAKKTRLSPTASLIENQFMPLIVDLRGEGLSWRQIAEYIRTHHHKKFAHGYLSVLYKQWHPAKTEIGGDS